MDQVPRTMRDLEPWVGECKFGALLVDFWLFPANASFGRNLVDAALGELTTTAASQSGTSMSTGAESDFVWAVRVTKIWKGTLDRTWSFRTQSKGATFSLEDEERKKEEVAQVVDAEEIGGAKKVWLGEGDQFLVF